MNFEERKYAAPSTIELIQGQNRNIATNGPACQLYES